MKKVILLASLLLIGVACSKNDNNEPSKKGDEKVEKPGDKGNDKSKSIPSPSPAPSPNPDPSPNPSSPAPSIGENVDPIFPKMKNGDNQYYSLTTYQKEGNRVKKVIRES